MLRNLITAVYCLFCLSFNAHAQTNSAAAAELYRPQFHFTPAHSWMNDPNGLIFYKGLYHLFFQYYPDSTVWGPMHWGHAVSKDLFNWAEQPIALYPDSLGYIFSGSAVLDTLNTSGFGKAGLPAIVAVFTYHNEALAKLKRKDFQYQGIAYSNDQGKTFTKYSGNPVLKNPGIIDFRDPKISWYAPAKKWVMTLATKDRISFYASPNLKDWQKLSEFGASVGAHGGVWECPDLLCFDYKGKKIWALLVSINPGGLNGGSATQYFLGNFDGVKFMPTDTVTRWLDYGTDNYAGVSFYNTGSRTIFLGWMSNWSYAQQVPTEKWRSATTLPRILSIVETGGHLLLAANPVDEMKVIKGPVQHYSGTTAAAQLTVAHSRNTAALFQLNLEAGSGADFSIELSNEEGAVLIVGYLAKEKKYYIDRRLAGENSFDTAFAKIIVAPRLSTAARAVVNLVVDRASVELFADGGRTVMTAIVFPKKPYSTLRLQTKSAGKMLHLSYTPLISAKMLSATTPQ
jgi:fructan beta-fructosidase